MSLIDGGLQDGYTLFFKQPSLVFSLSTMFLSGQISDFFNAKTKDSKSLSIYLIQFYLKCTNMHFNI